LKKLLTVLFLLPCNLLFLNPKTETTKFKVEISLSKSQVVLIGKEGFTFNQLSFNANRKVEINQSGMTKFDKITKTNCPSDFIFEYSKSNNQVHLKGIKGTNFATINLKFDAQHSTYIITENGIE
jgi:hypothetical protein